MTKKFNIFYILEALTNTKEDVTDHPQFEKEYNIFMINRWLSMNSQTVYEAFFSDQIQGLDKKHHFYFLRELIDKKKVFFKYKKGQKNDKNLKIIMEYYNIGEQEARMIVNILTGGEIKLLEKSFGGR